MTSRVSTAAHHLELGSCRMSFSSASHCGVFGKLQTVRDPVRDPLLTLHLTLRSLFAASHSERDQNAYRLSSSEGELQSRVVVRGEAVLWAAVPDASVLALLS